MKILWITNNLMPEPLNIISNSGKLKGTGGWIVSLCHALSGVPNIEIIVASVHSAIKEMTILQGKKNKFYVLPKGKGNLSYNKQYEMYWKKINKIENPDIVHIHGTEFSHGMAWICACGNQNVVVSIQGLVSIIQKYVFCEINKKDLLLHWKPINIIYTEKSNYKKRAKGEIEYMNSASYFIGRTDWDKAHIWKFNPSAKYFHCDEMLRDSFYTDQWTINNIEKYSLFISQANTSIKGLHQVLKAMPLVLRVFPQTKLYVGGARYFAKPKSLINNLKITTYNSYIKSLIRHLKIENNICFIAPMDEEEMRERLSRSHIFLLPSSIENSSNSLCEAQLLGVPSIASFVGGTPSLIKHGETGLLYRFEEYEMLAKYICEIFNDNQLAELLSKNERISAHKRHNKQRILNQTLETYNYIMQKNEKGKELE